MYPEPIGSDGDLRPVLCWEDYKWSPRAVVITAASKIVEEFWWRFKCDPSNQEKADAALEANFTNKHWSSAAFRKISLTNKKNRLAHGKTVFHTSGARSAVSTRQHMKLKNGQDPGISGAWLHTHNLHRGTDQEKICSQRTSERWENFDEAMTNAHGENWEEEHPELDAQIIYDAAGRMPHGRLGIANELFTRTEKSKIKARRPFVSQPVRSAREDRLQRENDRLKRDNKRFRGIELVVRSLAEKGGVDYDAIMQSIDLSPSDSEVGCESRQDADRQHDTEKEMGSNT
ncbi:unnamed protein product [Alopecurus aequalis]